MNTIKEEISTNIETLSNIFSVKNGKLEILLVKRNQEPYKGYWELPKKNIEKDKTLEENIDNLLSQILKRTNIFIEQDHTYINTEKNTNETCISISYVCLMHDKQEIINIDEKEIKWFSIDEIPKIALNHKEIIESAIEKLKTKLVNSNILKRIFPNEFTLPEIQTIFESILNVKLDRRNFRKKFINLGLIEETGYDNAIRSGRPAKLYKFKENIKEKNLF